MRVSRKNVQEDMSEKASCAAEKQGVIRIFCAQKAKKRTIDGKLL